MSTLAKRLLVTLVFALLPTTVFAQWTGPVLTIAGSGTTGAEPVPPSIVMSSDNSLVGTLDGSNDTYTLPEEASFVLFYKNGLLQEDPTHYSHSTDTIQTVVAPIVTDGLIAVYLPVGDSMAQPSVAKTSDATLSGAVDSLNTVYTLPVTAQFVLVYKGLLQEPVTHYSHTPGTDTITFTTAPTTGDNIVVYYWE